MHDVFTNDAHLIVLLAFSCLGAAIVVAEYGSGLIRTTFAAVPDRRAVLAAKVAVVTAITTLLGATTMVAVMASLILPPNIIDSRKHAWINDIHNATPFYAWQRLGLEGPVHRAPGEFAPPPVLESWLVYAAWPVVLVAVAMFAIGRRDV
jgi:hypothetical protein